MIGRCLRFVYLNCWISYDKMKINNENDQACACWPQETSTSPLPGKKTAFRNGSLNTTTQMHICIIYFIETNKQWRIFIKHLHWFVNNEYISNNTLVYEIKKFRKPLGIV